MADEKQRRTAGKHLFHAVVAFLLEHEVAHRQNFVAGQDVGPHLGGDGEAQAGDHAGRVVFHRHIDKIPQFCKVDDVLEVLVHIGTVMPQDGTVEVNVLAGGQLHIETGAQLDQRGDLTIDPHRTFGRVHHTGNKLEHRAFAAAVAADERDRFAGLDGEGHVLQSVELVKEKLMFSVFSCARLNRIETLST